MKKEVRRSGAAKLLNFLKYDIVQGILKMYPVYILEIIFVIMYGAGAAAKLSMYVENPSALEIMVMVFEGKLEYINRVNDSTYVFPMAFFILTILNTLLACYYPVREWSERGKVLLPRYQSKGVWWISKMLWCILQNIVYHMISFGGIWIMAMLKGNGEMTVRNDMGFAYYFTILTHSSFKILFYIIIISTMTTIVINQMVVTLQMIIHPVIAFMTALLVIAASAFWNSKYLIGNYCMLIRTEIFREDVCGAGFILCELVILWVLFSAAGWMIVRKKDII